MDIPTLESDRLVLRGFRTSDAADVQRLAGAFDKLVAAYSFSELGLVRLHARHLVRNPSSGRVLRKIGFAHEGSRKGHVKKWGKLEDVEDYGLMASDGI